ncbi:Uncharacterised protein [Urinicoccus massiliensis]|uniref:Cytochrome C biosynthesis protein n=1 Tax=Urinicoccus massiliensis TaxID=1723382 RepID=A0A8H2M5I8_9FIRM|nr:cytochrome C biosynthesis protein [Urinicoccus massiliensis]VFB16313.1 Uncharacterised protein [Urinicoccus massiliensis]
MDKILTALSGHYEFIVISIITILLAIFITFIMNLFAKDLTFLKYLPSLVFILIGVVSLLSVLNHLFDSASLNNILVTVICLTAGICSLLFALIIGLIHKQ